MSIRNRIWSELTQSKHNLEFVSLYSDRQRTFVKYFNIFILTFSSAGVMGWSVWESLPIISCVVIAIISLLRLLQPHLIGSDKQIKDIDEIQKFYANYFNKLEELWYSFERRKITEEEAMTKFYKIKETETELNPLIAEVIRNKPKKLIDKTKLNCDNYFNQIFNNEYD